MQSHITIEELRGLCNDETIFMTRHSLNRLIQRGIDYEDIKIVINNGEIIESYPTDFPYPSCLVMGLKDSENYLHVVAGIGDGKLWIITAYYPNPDKWESDYKTRKEVDNS